MAVEWKRLNLQNGKWVATFTAIGIAAGALMWYQREAPLYPSTLDEAEVRFALLERQAAAGSGESASNAVGFYPSRRFWIDTEYGAQSVPAMTRRRGSFINLWKLGGASALQRRIADYPNVIGESEKMELDYWRSNHYEHASFFGDYQYLHTNNYYMATNILFQVGRALSDMRWTLNLGTGFITMPDSLATNAMITWRSTDGLSESLPAAYSMALASLGDAVPKGGALSELEEFPVSEHYVVIRWGPRVGGGWCRAPRGRAN